MTARSLHELSAGALRTRLAAGLGLRIGPFNVSITSPDHTLAEQVHSCYPDYELAAPGAFFHAGVNIRRRRLRSRPWLRRGYIWLDDGAMFSDFKPGEGLPYLEWGINWCIATRCHFFLMLHAAVVAKNGVAVIMPGLPGAGKSTLSGYLAHHGWRLLSDEFCLLRPHTLDVVPFPRLVPLKNESIDVMAAAVPGARIGPRFVGTRKGTVAHVTPPARQARDSSTARARIIVKPRFVAGSPTELTPLAAAQCFVELSNNAFNYQVLGRDGFDTVAALMREASAHELRYSALEEAAAALDGVLEATLAERGVA